MTTIALKHLQTEGRLTLGDVLTHSENGDYEFLGCDDEGRLRVTNGKERLLWTINGFDGLPRRVVPIK